MKLILTEMPFQIPISKLEVSATYISLKQYKKIVLTHYIGVNSEINIQNISFIYRLLGIKFQMQMMMVSLFCIPFLLYYKKKKT